MIERNTTETRTPGGWTPALLILLAVLIVGVLVWQPWSASTSRDSSTTTNQSTTTQPTPTQPTP